MAKSRRVWIAAAIAIALGLVVVFGWKLRGREQWRLDVVDLPRWEERSDGASLSPDGTQIAWSSDGKGGAFRIYFANVDGSGERVHPADASYDAPRWTRDGKFVLSATNHELQKLPVGGGAPIPLGVTGNSPDDCGTGIVFIREQFDGHRLLYKPTDKPERELVRAYADEVLAGPRCDPSGTKIVFVRGRVPASAFGSDVYVSDLAGAILPLTTTHDAGAATWSHDGTTIVFASRWSDGKVQLVEVPATGGIPQQLTFGDGRASSPDISRDGQTLLFQRDVTRFSIDGGEGSGKPRAVSSRSETAFHLRVAAANGERLLAEGAGGVVVIDTATGTDRVLTPGYAPFPSLDGKTVYFRAVDDPKQLMAIPLAGGTAKEVAKLAGRIVVGTDGPDGQHVMVDEDEHHLVSIRVGLPTADGTPELTDEGAHWVVPAPSGGWRYWQKPGTELELRVIAPGKPLGSMDCVFSVDSMFNQWLDAHHLAYARGDAWHILDVRTCTDEQPRITVIEVGDHGGRNAVMAPDGKHWFTSKSVSRATRHAARNFSTRPR